MLTFAHFRRPPKLSSLPPLIILFGIVWQSVITTPQLASALFLLNTNNNNPQQQQQQAPTIITTSQLPVDNGVITQALSQFVAQQMSNNLAAVNNPNAATQQQQQQNSSLQAGQQQQQQQAANNNQFVIKWIHNDPKNQMAYVSITPVNYTNLHEPRIELRYQSKYPYVNLDERTPNNTVVAAVVVNDEDTGPSGETSLAIEQGNELGHFKLVSTQITNTIQVNGAPLSRHLKPEYNLTIVARDHGSPPKSSTSNLVIKLYQSSYSSPSQIASPEPQPSLKPPVTDLMFVGAMLVVIFSAVVFTIIIGCACVQRPKNKISHKNTVPVAGHPPTSRATSATSHRLHPGDQCTPFCLGLTNL